MLLELLFGELGPEPGALLHTESEQIKHILKKKKPTMPWKIRQPEQGGTAGHEPAMSRERFLAVVMGLSRRRSSGLLLRSLTFCFSLERSFRLGSEAEDKSEEH